MTLLFDMLAAEGHLGEGGAVLITVRPARGSRIDLDKLLECIETLAGDALRRRQSRAVIYVGQLFETDETSGEPGISVSRARFVENLINRNGALKSQDRERLIHLSVEELSAEIAEKSYDTSFAIVTARAVYERKPEEFSAPEETADTGGMQSGTDGAENGEEGDFREGEEPSGGEETTSGGAGEREDGQAPASGAGPQTQGEGNPVTEQPESDSAGTEPEPSEISAAESEPSEVPAEESEPSETSAAEPEPAETPAAEPESSEAPAEEPVPETPAAEPGPSETSAANSEPSETPAAETRAPWEVGPGYETEPETEIITDVMPAFREDGPGM